MEPVSNVLRSELNGDGQSCELRDGRVGDRLSRFNSNSSCWCRVFDFNRAYAFSVHCGFVHRHYTNFLWNVKSQLLFRMHFDGRLDSVSKNVVLIKSGRWVKCEV